MSEPRPAPTPVGRIGAFWALPKDGAPKTILISLAICFCCSLAVTSATILLRPIKQENLRRLQQEGIRDILSRQPGIGALLDAASDTTIEEQVVELATGLLAPELAPSQVPGSTGTLTPENSEAIPPELDVARLQRRARYAVVYLVRRAGQVDGVVVPVQGRGYASLIQGFVALAKDANTIMGLTITGHEETPGIGSEIEDAAWRQQWSGKQLRNAQDQLVLEVYQEDEAPAGDPADPHRVAGITGATRSSLGVGNAVRFWMGEQGFGPFLARLRAGEIR